MFGEIFKFYSSALNITQTTTPDIQLGGGIFTVTVTREDSQENTAICSFDLFVDTTLSITNSELTVIGKR